MNLIITDALLRKESFIAMREFMIILLAVLGVVLALLGRKMRTPLRIVFLAVFAVLYYYLFYPAINICSLGLWIMVCILILMACFLFPAGKSAALFVKGKSSQEVNVNPSAIRRPFIVALGLILLAQLISLIIFSPLFQSGSYSSRISVKSVDFSEIPEYDFAQTAIIDRSSAELLGDKVMGQMTDLVSQFSVSDEYPQISFKGASVRVTPLAYNGFIKYMRNRESGVPGYISVSSTSGKTELKRLDEGMRYVPSAYANENLYRKIQFQHPFTLFGSPDFEIDEDEKPWYICTTYSYSGLHSIRRVSGVILFDPVSGQSEVYSLDDVPDWVDRVCPSSLVLTELNDYGKYQKGFFNSIFGQEGVIKTSDGYNYLAKDGDIWLYTGMTSASGDDSNVGFVLVNMRTHEAQYTATPGAGETAVMASAEGEVLNYGYTATFPTLLNVGGKPYYLLSLKDSAGLVKMYCMVDAQDYQQVYTVKAGKDTKSAITSLLRQAGGTSIQAGSGEPTQSIEFTIREIREAVIEGNTWLYLDGTAEGLETAGDETAMDETEADVTTAATAEVAVTATDGTDAVSKKTAAPAICVIQVTQENAKDALYLKENDTIQAECSAQDDGTYLILSFELTK